MRDAATQVTVEDYDRFSGNDFMGTCLIDVKTLADRELHRATYYLTDAKGKLRRKPRTRGFERRADLSGQGSRRQRE